MASILLIDDEYELRSMLADFLEDEGHEVLQAGDGPEGLELFSQHQPDLVLLDLRMPGMDGLAVLDAIRGISPSAPVAVVSGAGRMDDVIEALRRGAWDYLNKPLQDMAILRHAVDRCLERARLLNEREAYQRKLEEVVENRTRELQQAKREITEQYLFQSMLFQSIPIPVYYRDLSGRVMDCNEALAKLVNQPKQRIIGAKTKDFYPPDLASRMESLDEELFRKPGPQAINSAVALPGFHLPRRILAFRELVRDAAGRPTGIVGLILDITDYCLASPDGDPDAAQRTCCQEETALFSSAKVISSTAAELAGLWVSLGARLSEQSSESIADLTHKAGELLERIQDAAATVTACSLLQDKNQH